MLSTDVGRGVLSFRLTTRACRQWRRELVGLEYPDPAATAELEEFVQRSREIANRYLPRGIVASMKAVGEAHGPLAVVVRDGPTDSHVPAPPTDGLRPQDKAESISEGYLCGCVAAAGEPFDYYQKGYSSFITQVAPATGFEDSNSGASKEPLGEHTDNSILLPQFQTDDINLTTLVNDAKVPTWICDTRELLDLLSHDEIADLAEARYRYPLPYNLSGADVEMWTAPRPILRLREGASPEIALSPLGIRGVDGEADMSFSALRRAIRNVAGVSINLRPGDFLRFSNRFSIHGRRGAIKGSRWLQRLYSRGELNTLRERTVSAPPIRMFDQRLLILD